MNGTLRHTLVPLLSPCTRALQTQQLINLKHFSARFRPTRIVTRAAATLQPVQQRTQEIRPQLSAEFLSLGLSTELSTATQANGISQPTEIQAAAIPGMIKGGDVLLASHTGSGKTLAYLLPLVQKLRQQEQNGQQTKPKRPRALVLGPTRELTDQILQVAKSLSHHARFRSACVNGGGTSAQQAAALATPLDILVATPQKLLQHAEKGNVYYGDVQYVVLDEADTMFDRGFGPEVEKVLGPLRSKAEPAQCILVAATLTKPIRRLLDEKFPNMQRIETKSLHRGVAGAQHTFIKQEGGQDKLAMLLQVVQGEQRRGHKVMVFCNTLDSCRAADKYLQEHNLPSLSYHGDVPLDGRRQAIQSFAQGGEGGETDTYTGGRQTSSQPVLVCTDLAARGLDIPGKVDHVVNFDFPYNPVDYIHRTGRTARAGQKGRVSSLIAKGDQVLASRIEQALQQGLPMDELSADRKTLPPNMRPKPETYERRANERKADKHKGRRGAARFEKPSARKTNPAKGQGKPSSSARGRFGLPSRPSDMKPGKPNYSKTPSFSKTSFDTNKASKFDKFGKPTESQGNKGSGKFGRYGQTSFGDHSPDKSKPGSSGKGGRYGKSSGSSSGRGRPSSSSRYGKPAGKPSSGSRFGKPAGRPGSSTRPGKPAGRRPVSGKKKGLGRHKSFKGK